MNQNSSCAESSLSVDGRATVPKGGGINGKSLVSESSSIVDISITCIDGDIKARSSVAESLSFDNDTSATP